MVIFNFFKIYVVSLKVYVAFALLMATVMAEPPRYRPQQQQQRQFYFARQQEETTTAANAPYAPSGWRPAGPAFNLPQRAPQRQYGAPSAPQQQYGAPAAPQQQYGAPAAPQQQYGAPSAPQQQYGAPSAPQQQYGPPAVPQQQYGPPQETTTAEAPTTTEAEDATTVAGITDSEVRVTFASNSFLCAPCNWKLAWSNRSALLCCRFFNNKKLCKLSYFQNDRISVAERILSRATLHENFLSKEDRVDPRERHEGKREGSKGSN